MALAYSQRLYLGHHVSSDGFTVPTDRTWVIRTITVFWPGGSVTPGAQLVDVLSGATIWWDTDTISVAGLYHHLDDVRIVLPAASAINVLGFGDPDITLNGYSLTLP